MTTKMKIWNEDFESGKMTVDGEEVKLILKVLVGSRAHGTHRSDSDYDYRGVFLRPTVRFHTLGLHKPKQTAWVEDEEDNVAWELEHFLTMAIHSNPSVLETLVSPIVAATTEGQELRGLFAALWNSRDAYNAFLGYGKNQLKKMIENKDDKWEKYAYQHLLVLDWLERLLMTGSFTTKLPWDSPFKTIVMMVKNGQYTMGDALNMIYLHRDTLIKRWESRQFIHMDRQTNLESVNHFLHNIRMKFYWSINTE